MLDLARLLEVSVELLAAIAAGVVAAAGFEELASAVGQNDGVVSVPSERDGSKRSLFAEVPEIASPRIGRTIVVVAEITSRDHPKRSDGTERTGFRPSKFVFVVAIADDFTFETSRQIEVVREHVAWINRVAIAVALVIVAVSRAVQDDA